MLAGVRRLISWHARRICIGVDTSFTAKHVYFKIVVVVQELKHIRIEINDQPIGFIINGNYLEIERRLEGEKLNIYYPMPMFEEEISIGNPGFRRYRYVVTWKGDTVVRMEP